jgi:predicted kinase
MEENEDNKKKELDCKILIGVPASGKSTWSTDFVKKNPKYVRLNRDSYRYMLKDQGFCEPKIEDIITDMFFHGIDVALSRKLSLILDNTNLKRSVIDELVKYVETRANVSFMVFPISLETAIERDNAREKKVGEEVIKKMYKAYEDLMDSYNYSDQKKKIFVYKEPLWLPNLPKITIFDLDGTLTHANGKRSYFDWYKCDRDDLDQVVYRAYQRHLAAGDTIFIITGREEYARESTELWLSTYAPGYQRLLMREKDDRRPDYVVKAELYNEHIKGKFNVEVIYEDKPKVVDMWRELGLKVFQVSKGDH